LPLIGCPPQPVRGILFNRKAAGDRRLQLLLGEVVLIAKNSEFLKNPESCLQLLI
jgi:hypothetical protein